MEDEVKILYDEDTDVSVELEDGNITGLPEALSNLRIKQYCFAVIAFFASIGFAIGLKDWRILFFILLSLYLAYSGYSLGTKYKNGDIEEHLLVCSAVRPSTLKDNVTVSFRTDEDIPAFYQFVIPGKKNAEKFIPNTVYVLYVAKSDPTHILTYTVI